MGSSGAALQRLADIAVAWDDGASALAWAERAHELAGEHGPPGAEALGAYTVGAAQLLLGESDRAEESLARSLALFRLVGGADRVPSPVNIAELRWPGLGGAIGPRVLFEDTLQPFQELTGRTAVSHVLVNQAGVARVRGELARARELTDEAEAIARRGRAGLAAVLVRRAYLELAEGDLDAARAALERGLELRRRLRDRRGIGMALAGLGFVDAVAGELDRADAELGEARDLFRRAGDRWGYASTLWRTADLELARGRYDDAEAALEQAIAALGATRRPRWLAHTAFSQAEVALVRGDPGLAATRLAEARELYVLSSDLTGVAAVDERFALLPGALIRCKAHLRTTPRTRTKEGEMSATISPVIGEATMQELREAVKGEVLAPGDAGYEEACHVWNGMFDERRPALIVRCEGAADVIAAVGFARSNDLPLAVRGGSHSVAGFSAPDGGLVVDLSPMRNVRVDPDAGVAYVGGGATWADVDHETQAHGLATTGGLVSSTGVGGFTLGGGVGWLMRKHGLACDNLVGADVVTADGHAGAREREREPGAPVGPPRRRRQLRGRDPVRAEAP